MEALQQQTKPEKSYGGFIAYKLKSIPEDFQVTELSDLEVLNTRSRYRVYRLRKSGWNTKDVLERIARKNQIPYDRLAYGGKKDRHALTVQYVTSDLSGDLSCEEKGWSFEWVGYADSPMNPHRIAGNHFTITFRSLHGNEIPFLQRNVKKYRTDPFPNYFDKQRFGCVHPESGMPGIQVLRGNYELAVKAALGCYQSGEKGPEKKRKNSIVQFWGDWKKCIELSRGYEKRIFENLLTASRSGPVKEETFRTALNFLPSEDLSMYFSAAQSRLWNGMLRKWIENNISSILIKNGSEDPAIPLVPVLADQAISFEVPGPGTSYENNVLNLFQSILQENDLRDLHYAVPGLEGSFFSSHARATFVTARDFTVPEIAPDDLNPGRKKATLGFSLPAGSYATMLVKCLTLRNTAISQESQ